MPTILGITCSNQPASVTDITATLPSWTAGDLAVVFLSSDAIRTWSNASGYAQASAESGQLPSGSIWTKVLEVGDTDPVFTANVGRPQQAFAVIIDDGTFDSDSPVDVVTTNGAWNFGSSATPQASSVTTNTNGALALAYFAADDDDHPHSVTTSGWNDTPSADCPSITAAGSLWVADKEIASAGATGAVDFSMNAAEQWCAAIVAIKPAAAAGGISADATPGTLTLTGQAADQIFTTNLSLDATPGTLTLTGIAADQVITETGAVAYEGTPGALSLAGQTGDVAITTNLSLEASPGAITLTGQAADFQAGVFINADATPGAIALTGQAATVDITTALTLEAIPGTLTLSGQQADVLGLVAPAIAAPAAGGIKSRYRRYKRKTVIIGKKRYQVTSPEEEAMLVRRYIDELKAERETVQTEPAEAKKVTRRLKLAATRLRKLDVDPAAPLKALDDELLTMLGGVPWL